MSVVAIRYRGCAAVSWLNARHARRGAYIYTYQSRTPHYQTHSNDDGTAAASLPEATPEVWDRIRALLRALPPSDSLSRSANSLEKEVEVGRWVRPDCERGWWREGWWEDGG